jgi:hypothetical protein
MRSVEPAAHFGELLLCLRSVFRLLGAAQLIGLAPTLI